MVWTRTLAQLVTDVTTRCDVDGYTSRHPTASVRRLVEESYQRLREMMTTSGSRKFIGGPYLLNGANSVWQRGLLDYGVELPLAYQGTTMLPLESPMNVEAKISGKWTDLTAIDIGDIHDWYPQNSANNNQPEAWCLLGQGSATAGPSSLLDGDPISPETTAGGMLTLLIVPKFDPYAIPIQVYASPVITIVDADATTLTLDGPGFEWIIWDSIIKIASRDNDSQGTLAIATQERTKAEFDIRQAIRRENKASNQRRDVFRGGRMGAFRRGRSAL